MTISEQVSTLGWWLSVVVVGIVVSLAAAYLKPVLDSLGGKFVSVWARRTEWRRKARAKRVEDIAADSREEALCLTESLQGTLYAILYFMLGAVFFLFRYLRFTYFAAQGRMTSEVFQTGDTVVFAGAAFSLVLGFLYALDGALLLQLVRDARAARRQSQSP